MNRNQLVINKKYAITALGTFIVLGAVIFAFVTTNNAHVISGKTLGLSQIVLMLSALLLLTGAILFFDITVRLFRDFFCTEEHPVNLAIFRITIFAVMLAVLNETEVLWYSRFPKELFFPPTGTEWILSWIPINALWASRAIVLYKVFCWMALIGFFTRFSSLMSVFLGLYVLGIPQFFGKVNHEHFLLWFAMLIGVSRSGDFLSFDAVIRAWKRADKGITAGPGLSKSYSLPLRFVWILIGIAYFFPGFWKVWNGGFYWGLSDNMKYQLYSIWIFQSDWNPLFRIDQYPFLYRLAGVGTILFELSFIVLIFIPLLRPLAVIGGISFHFMIKLFMRINFWTLQVCYVAFFDWNKIFLRCGRWIYKKDMFILFDGNCQLCRRTIAIFRVFDIFQRIVYVNMFDQKLIHENKLSWIDSADVIKDMHVVVDKKIVKGFRAYQRIAWRIPILWPLIPLLFLWPMPVIGEKIYRHVADTRSCTIPDNTVHINKNAEIQSSVFRMTPVIFTGIFLVVMNFSFGVMEKTQAWPFACFPTFSFSPKGTAETLEISVITHQGEELHFTSYTVKSHFQSGRLKFLIDRILNSQDTQQKISRLRALWNVWTEENEIFQSASNVQFYIVQLSTIPEERLLNPLSKELIYEFQPQK